MRGLLLLAFALLVTPLSLNARERIVTLAPHLAELVCAVNACDLLVGVSEYTDAPAEAARRPKVGNGFDANVEAVLALRPTRVLVWDGGNAPATIERLRRLKLPVTAIRVRDLDAVAAALEQVGTLAGKPDEGRRAAHDYRTRLATLRAQYRERPRLRAFYQIDAAPAYTINRDSPISAALSLCGADNVFGGLPTIAAAVSAEAVLAADPDVLVFSDVENRAAITAYWERLKPTRAADPRRQVIVDANQLTRQSPRVLEGIAGLCAGLDRVRADTARRDAR